MKLIKILIFLYIFLFPPLTPRGYAESPTTRILFLGDSLTDGYGVPKDKTYPALVLNKLRLQGKKVEVINAGISGSTTASGYKRLKWHLKQPPNILVLALGANDGLRGLKIEKSKENLRKVIVLAKKNGIKVLLAGMKMPTNYGKEYSKKFHQMFFDLAKENNIALIPFLLEGVGGKPQMNQADGIHPNEEGHKVISDIVLRYLGELL